MDNNVEEAHKGDNESKTSPEAKSDGPSQVQAQNRRPVASFSMAAALNMVKRRQEELKRAKEEEEKNLEVDKKERARAKRKRRRQNQKLAKSKAKAKLLENGNDPEGQDSEDDDEKEEDIEGGGKFDEKQQQQDKNLDSRISSDDGPEAVSQLPAKKRFKGDGNSKDIASNVMGVSISKESTSSLPAEAPDIGSSNSQSSGRFNSLVPRALMIKRKASENK